MLETHADRKWGDVRVIGTSESLHKLKLKRVCSSTRDWKVDRIEEDVLRVDLPLYQLFGKCNKDRLGR